MVRSRALASVVLVAGVLAGCGDGEEEARTATENYCEALRDADEEFSALSGEAPDPARLEGALDRLGELAEQAPDEVQAEWEVLDNAISEVRQGLEDAGVSFEDLEQLSDNPTELPEDVDPGKLMELGRKVQEMSSQEFRDASDRIRRHAKRECDVDLGS